MTPITPMSLIAVAILILAFAAATFYAYRLGRRDEATRFHGLRAEWDRRAWFAGRQSAKRRPPRPFRAPRSVSGRN